MPIATELSALFRRDLTRVIQQISAFPDEKTLWAVTPGMSNSAGNLALHLEGNLREYIGRQLGGIAFERRRALEFSTAGLPAGDLVERLSAVKEMAARVIEQMPDDAFETKFPEDVLGVPMTKRQLVIHLGGHLNYHLGQIDCLRRFLTGKGAISLAGLRS